MRYESSLTHYASPYYDPVKAHEYYIKNRELKGRTSTAKLNDEGKAAAKYVKDKLNAERKAKVDAHKKKTDKYIDTQRESLKAQKQATMDSHRESMNAEISALRSRLKGMNRQQAAAQREAIQTQIDALRANNQEVRQYLSQKYSSSVSKMSTSARKKHSETREKLKKEYDQKYVDELDKIRSEGGFLKPNKR